MSVPAAQINKTASTGSFKMVAVMGIVGTLASILLVATYQYTLPLIEANRAEFLESAIFDVLPGTVKKQTFTAGEDGVLIPLEDDKALVQKYYAGYDAEGKLVGVAAEAEGQGFQDKIRLLYGYSPECECIVGMKVLETKETPGLGDKIEKDEDFRSVFLSLDVKLDQSGQKLQNPITLIKPGTPREPWEIVAITGATVSSKAVTTIINTSASEVVPLIQKNLAVLQQTGGAATAGM